MVEEREEKQHPAVAAGEPAEHNHFWKLIGRVGQRWKKGHAMAKCLRCSGITVVEFGALGPCKHVVGPAQAQAQTLLMEWERCERCGAMMDEEGCTGCGSGPEG